MRSSPRQQAPDSRHWVKQPGGPSNVFTGPEGRFTVVARDNIDARHFLRLDAYSAANAFVDGRFEVHGDLIAAVRFFSNQPHSGIRQVLYSMLARLEHLRIYSLFGAKDEAAKSVQYHYDRSNDFYSLFLDSRLVYSAAYFESPDDSLERAQQRKLELICRDLALRPGDHLLDIGCGWGGLIIHAGEQFGATAHGCTIAAQQLDWAKSEIDRRGLGNRVTVSLCDYREVKGAYEKIASVGMFEHVGKSRLPEYFRKMYALLKPGGLFLNRGVVRPQGITHGPETLFVQKSVFPGGELVHLDDMLREAERAGFEAVALRDLRMHYALTCRAWVKNLELHKERCSALVGDRTYRSWLLYLAGSSVAFEEGRTGAAQIMFEKPHG